MTTDEKKKHVRTELAGLRTKEATQRKAELATELNTTVRTINRWSSDLRTGRKKRSDRGATKNLDESQLNTLFSYAINTNASAKNTIAWGVANQVIDLGQITENRFNTIKTARGLTRKAIGLEPMSRNAPADSLRPCRKMFAPHPNFHWQIDATVLEQFRIGVDDKVNPLGFEEKYKKTIDTRPRPVAFVIQDYFSKCVFIKVYPVENASTAMDFLFEAISEKASPKNPFHGIPVQLYKDNGPGFRSEVFGRACHELNIEEPPRLPYASRATGMVERMMKTLNEWMDANAIKYFDSLESMNTAIDKLVVVYNNRMHSTTNEKPFDKWLTIKPSQLVAPPRYELYRKLKYSETTRMIDKYLCIKLNNRTYELPFDPFEKYRQMGRPVKVRFLQNYPSEIEVMHEGTAISIREGVRIHPIGEFKRHPARPAEKHFRQAKSREMKEQLEALNESPFKAEFEDAPLRTSPAAGSRQSLEVPELLVGRTEAKLIMAEHGLKWLELPSRAVSFFDQLFPDDDVRVTETQLNDLIASIEEMSLDDQVDQTSQSAG